MRLVLDAGALIGIDRHDRRVAGLIELARRAGAELVTVAPVRRSGMAGRRAADGPRPCPRTWSRSGRRADEARPAAGELLAAAGASDVIDALVALAALPGDQVLTSDPADLSALLDARGVTARVVRV